MTTAKINKTGRWIAGVVMLLILSCDPTGSTSGTQPTAPPGSTELNPPGTVAVSLVGGIMAVTWDQVNRADAYEVYRKEGAAGFVSIASVTDTQYNDATYDPRKTLQYAVRCWWDDKPSKPSIPTPPISRYVQELYASRFEYTPARPADHGGQIVVSWKAHPRAVSYMVYRYLSKADTVAQATAEVSTPFFEDVHIPGNPATIQPGVPCYYRVAWIEVVNNKKEVKGGDGPFSLGVFTYAEDFAEPNDDPGLLFDQTVSSAFNPGQPSLIYSFGDNQSGNITADTDWYKYYGPPAWFQVMVELPPDTPFQGEELRFRFYYNGEYYDPVPLYKSTGNINPNVFPFDQFGDNPGAAVSVYFCVYPVCASSRDVYGTYQVELSREF